jgi:hypothetical protein
MQRIGKSQRKGNIMRKLLLVFAASLALLAPAHASSVTVAWTAAAPVSPNPTDITGYQVQQVATVAGQPPVTTTLTTVGPTVTTAKTGQLAAGTYQYLVTATYGEGSAQPASSPVVTISATVTLAPATNVTATVGP